VEPVRTTGLRPGVLITTPLLIMKKEPYTKMTLEIYYPFKNDYCKYSMKINRWDASPKDMIELFKGLLLAAGFHPDTIKEWIE
jgi:hypothetical protein